jgi:uncharacterized protein (TIGR03437 family)
MKRIAVCVLVSNLAFCSLARAQSGIITTVAGAAFAFPTNVTIALNAPLGYVTGVAVDSQGNVYVADASNDRIFLVSLNGGIRIVAGNGTTGFSGDGGPATSAGLLGPFGVAVDASGNLFIADSGNNRVRKVSANGIITTVAGGGNSGLGDGGPATAAVLNAIGVAVDVSGNLFLADAIDGRIRKVSPGGIITTVAGSGIAGFSGDGGPAGSASLNYPRGLAADASGNLFIADATNERIRKVSAGGVITTVAGNGDFGFSGDGGPATSASLNQPQSIVVDASGSLFIADTYNNRIRKVSASGVMTTVAGSAPGFPASGFSGDGGPATLASLSLPSGIAEDAAGNLFIADTNNNRIRKVSASGIITTVAGNGNAGSSGDGGLATSAWLSQPEGVAVDASGNLFIADSGSSRIRKVSAGIITTVATAGQPVAVAVDASGNLFIVDTFYGRIQEVSTSGILTTVAGGGTSGLGDGGPAISAELLFPYGVAVDASGNLFIADTGDMLIRKVSASGIITTAAGNGNNVFSGDGGPATSASLTRPGGVAVDASGNLFIADTLNNRIRKVLAVAPSPSVPSAGVTDGAGFSARISAGGIGSIFGTNVALATTTASSLPLPTTLSGTTVILDGIPAPLFFVSPRQINFQVPWELLGSTNATLSVATAGGTSSTITVSLSSAAPGIFTISTANSVAQGAIQIANTMTFAAPAGAISGATSRPATTGDMLTIYCSGLGAVTNPPASGSAAAGGVGISNVQAQVSVTIGGRPAPVLSASLTPGFVGLYQVNVPFPSGVASGKAVPVIVTTANLNSNTATIAVQ